MQDVNDSPVDRSYQYDRREKLGNGAFATAFLAVHRPTGKQCVLKRVSLSRLTDWQRRATKQEMEMMASLHHPYIVPYLDGWIAEKHTANMVMGYCQGGDLGAYLEKKKSKGKYIPVETLKNWLCQVLLALEYLQVHKVVHRDIKTSNLLLTADMDVQLGDFGLATFRETGGDNSKKEDTNLVGTPHYMSPEILKRQPYDFKTDVWCVTKTASQGLLDYLATTELPSQSTRATSTGRSMACVFWELSYQCPVFNAFDLNGLVRKIKENNVQTKRPKYAVQHYNQDWHDLLLKLLVKDAAKRLTVQQIMSLPELRTNMEFARRRAEQLQPGLVLPPFLPAAGVATPSHPAADAGASPRRSLSAEEPWTPETTQARSRSHAIRCNDSEERVAEPGTTQHQASSAANDSGEGMAAAAASAAGGDGGGESDGGVNGFDEGAWGSSIDRLEQGESSEAPASQSSNSRGSSCSPATVQAAAAVPSHGPVSGHGLLPVASSSAAVTSTQASPAAKQQSISYGVRQPGIAATAAQRVQAAIGMAQRPPGAVVAASAVDGGSKQRRPFSSPGFYVSPPARCRGSAAGVPAATATQSSVPCIEQEGERAPGLEAPASAALTAAAELCAPGSSAAALRLDLKQNSKRGWRDAEGNPSPRTRPVSTAGGTTPAAKAGAVQRRKTSGGVLSMLGTASGTTNQQQQQQQPTPRRSAAAARGLDQLAAAASGAAAKGVLFTKGRGPDPAATKAGLIRARHNQPRGSSAGLGGSAAAAASGLGAAGSLGQTAAVKVSKPAQQRARVQSAGGILQRPSRRVGELPSASGAREGIGASTGGSSSGAGQPGWDINGRRRILRHAGDVAAEAEGDAGSLPTAEAEAFAPPSSQVAQTAAWSPSLPAAAAGGTAPQSSGCAGRLALTPVQSSPQADPSSTQHEREVTPGDADTRGEAIRKLSFGSAPPTTCSSCSSLSPELRPLCTSSSSSTAVEAAVSRGSSRGVASGGSSPRVGLGKHEVSWRRPKQPPEVEQQREEAGPSGGEPVRADGLFGGHLMEQQQQLSRLGSGSAATSTSAQAAGAAAPAAMSKGGKMQQDLQGEKEYRQQQDQQRHGQLYDFMGTSSCIGRIEGVSATVQLPAAVLGLGPSRSGEQQQVQTATVSHGAIQAAPLATAAAAVQDMSAGVAPAKGGSRSSQTEASARAVGMADVHGGGAGIAQLERERALLGNVLAVVSGLLQRGQTEAARLMISKSLPELTAASTAAPAVNHSELLKLGDPVQFGKGGRITGQIRYLGPVHWDHSRQDYVGVQVAECKGNRGGTVDGVFYFDAGPRCAMFETAARLVPDN